MRRLVFNMRDERSVWAPPAWVVPEIRSLLGTGWDVIEVDATVSGRGDGAGVSRAAPAAVPGAEIYFTLGLPREILQVALDPPLLRWIHSGAAGVGSLLHPELRTSDITLTNSAGIHSEPMADTVLGMMLYFARGLDYAVRSQREQAWRPDPFEQESNGVRELADATVGIAGLGGIGRAVARRARALGMHVIGTRRSDDDVEGIEILRGDDSLETLLRRSDFLVLCLPSTSESRGLIGAGELALLQNDAVLISVGRGDVLDEDALVRALECRQIRGAALDVFQHEPLPSTSPLWSLPNVLITPHVSATSTRYWEREFELMRSNIRRYLDGAPLLNQVDPAVGY